MGWLRRWQGWRGAGVLLVALSLAVRLAAPTGWMLTPGDNGPRMVICTGHGAATLADPGKAPAHAPDKSPEHACVFAGAHAAPTPPAPVASLASVPAPAAEPSRGSLADQRPGRGLAAPPPPSQGPPTLA